MNVRVMRLWLALLFCISALTTQAQPGDARPWRFQGVERIVAFGDVHGDYDALVELLAHAGIVDDALRWAGGDTHLVSLGDLLDRGPDSRRVMDLLMRLQGEARAAGGHLHVVLGNHEQMNLTGDLRYVAPAEFAAFAGPEDDRLRAEALAEAAALDLPPDSVTQRPAGFFAHRAAFAADGHYGAWLLDQHVLVVIDGRVFVHGGLSPVLVDDPAVTPSRLDAQLRETMHRAVELASRPAFRRPDRIGTDLLDFADATADEIAAWPEELADVAPMLATFAAHPLFDSHGPFWHRGNAGCHALLEGPALSSALARLDASEVVVGHTVQRDHRVHVRLDGRVLMADTGMLGAYYGGVPRALLFENGEVRVLSPDGAQARPDPVRPAVDADLSAATLEALLSRGEVVASRRDGGGDVVHLRLGEDEVRVRVERAGRRARAHEIAAFRLDRLLGLGMVPAVAERTLEGREVLLRVAEGEWIDETERAASGRGLINWCARGDVFDLVRLFDTLTGNRRSADELYYRVPDYALMLTAHADAFPRSSRVSADDLDPVLAPVLERLDESSLREALGEVLDDRRLDALVDRRDALLEALTGV